MNHPMKIVASFRHRWSALLTLFFFMSTLPLLRAQKAELLTWSPDESHQRSACTGAMDAGSILQITPLGAQSNDLDHPDYVLCFGDQLFINHSGDAVFDGDPDPGTGAGVAYAFYKDCMPQETGETVNDITLDPCLITDPQPENGAMWVARGNREGDVVFHNGGQIQEQFFDGSPGRIWFAPITATNLDAMPIAFDDGSCVNVRIDQAFSVLYLNEIVLTDFTTPSGGLSGQFGLSGGMSEITDDPYNVTLTLRDDPSITGSIDAAISHGGMTTFSVPEPGIYELTVTDSKGCSKTFVVSVPAEDPVGFCIPHIDVGHNETECVAITVTDFDSILTFQTTITWDPTIIEFVNLSNFNDILGGILVDDDPQTVAKGILPLTWFDLSAEHQSLEDGDTLFEICFRGVGIPGSISSLSFGNEPTETAITDESELPFTLKNGSIRITTPAAPTVFHQSCPDGSGTSTITMQAHGGTDPYFYNLIDELTSTIVRSGSLAAYPATVTLDNIQDGSYRIEINDSSDPINSTITEVFSTVGELVLANVESLDPSCPTSDDGKIAIDSFIGGVGPYTSIWIAPDRIKYNIDSLENLAAGEYQIIVSDANGCMDTVDVTLAAENFMANVNVTEQPLCADSMGTISIDVTGNAPMYQFQVYDELSNRLVNESGPTGFMVNNLLPGNYEVIVGDDACTDTIPFSLMPRTQLSLNIEEHENIQCPGEANGRIRLAVTGRNTSGSFQFDWTPNVTAASGNDTSTVISQLGADQYSITVTDMGVGCRVDTQLTIMEPEPFRLNAVPKSPACGETIGGSVDLFFPEGGTQFPPPMPPYKYQWFDENGIQLSRTSTLPPFGGPPIPNGTYTLVLTDANGCIDTSEYQLRAGPLVASVVGEPLECAGDDDAVLYIEGDLEGNDIMWSTGETTDTIRNLAAGLYTVSVTENGPMGTCTVVDSITIVDPAQDIRVTTPMQFFPLSRCNEPDSGRIFNLQLSGIRGPTDIVWPTLGDTTSIPFINVFTSDTFPFSVVDRLKGCTLYDSFVVASFPEKIEVSLDTASVSCNGRSDGQISVMATGRGGLFDFAWSTGMIEPTPTDQSQISNLSPGIYSVSVTEAADLTCIVPIDIVISEPEVLQLRVDSANTQDIRCFGEQNGQIELIWEGGNRDAAPVISWSAGGMPNSLSATSLPAGTYGITLEDSRGCSDSVTVAIDEPGEIFATIPTPQQPICNGFQTSITVNAVSGGTGSNYTFSVDNGPNQPIGSSIPVLSGEHLITVFDEMGCRLDSSLFISEPDPIGVDLGGEVSVSLGDSVRLTPDVDGIVPIDSFIWTPVEFLSCQGCDQPFASPQQDQEFQLIVVDANGCRGRDEVLVRVDKARKIYIPNAFAPSGNGDPENDFWRIYAGVGVESINSTHVFDRWGNLVFQKGRENPSPLGTTGWDGRFEGQLLRPGVYTYVVEVAFIDGRVLLYRGDITLIR